MSENRCGLCGKDVSSEDFILHREIEAMTLSSIRAAHPEWHDENGVCKPCYDHLKKQLAAADDVRHD